MTYKAIYLTFSVAVLGLNITAAQAQNDYPPLEICGNKAQGGIMRGHIDNAYKIYQNEKEISVSEAGDFLLAFGRDEAYQQSVRISYNIPEEDYPSDSYTFSITPTKWDIQKINGVAQSKVTPGESHRDEILRENQSVRKALSENNTTKSYWKQGFIEPLEKYRISGEFGGQRIINTIPKSPHRGLDMAAPLGTPIKAAADGVVKLSGGNFFYSGDMVIIDHGQGLHTMYAHMKDTSVKVGDEVKQGQIIGTVGQTGRATGAHLHWGASLNDTRFNPSSLLKLNDNSLCYKI